MPPKKRQHRVPRVYLREFCDPQPPSDWPSGRPFTPALWVHPTSLDSPPQRRSPSNVAWERDSYTLKNDDPAQPWLEECFSKLESYLAPVLQRIRCGASLSHQDQVWLALFVGSQHERTRGITEQRRQFFASVARLSGWIRSENEVADALLADWERELPRELALRQLPTFMQSFATVVAPHARILDNRTDYLFITSDHPVYYGQLHADELVRAGFDARTMYQDIPRSAREFFVLCPLTPWHTYVSCPFFPPAASIGHELLEDPRMVISLNERIRHSAATELYASVADPYRDYGPAVAHLLAAAHAEQARMPESVQIYTDDDRFTLAISHGEHRDGDHPLHTNYAFRTRDVSALRVVGDAERLMEVTIFAEGREAAGMRDARFLSVAIDEYGESVIESGPRF